METVTEDTDAPAIHLDYPPLVVQFRPLIELDEDQFFEFCQLNRDLRIERNAQGEIILMPPTGWKTGDRNAELTMQLRMWAKQDGTGMAVDSSCGFRLPNSAVRSPDAAWIEKSRLEALTEEQFEKFLPLCPDFVIELRSRTDRLRVVQEKMQEYMDNGTQLGWLIDPQARRVYVYRPATKVEELNNPETISGEPPLNGFTLDLREVW